MSIYPVRIDEWFTEPAELAVLRDILAASKCEQCEKPVGISKGWAMHAILWGYGEVWCSVNCLEKHEKVKKS